MMITTTGAFSAAGDSAATFVGEASTGPTPPSPRLQRAIDGLNAIERRLVLERLRPVEALIEKVGVLGGVNPIVLIEHMRFEIAHAMGDALELFHRLETE